MKLRTWVAASILLCAPGLPATTLPRLSVDKLYAHADVVAVVVIESGGIVSGGGKTCGIKYSGRVVHSMKGVFQPGDIVEFGPQVGLGVGTQKLVFLNERSAVYHPRMSTNSRAPAEEAAAQEACAPVAAKYVVMFDGMGVLDISWTSKFQYREAVVFKDKWIAAPAGVELKVRERGDDRIESTEYWVKVDDVVDYLKKLQRESPAGPQGMSDAN